ncbi:Calcipressin-3 [Lamellibrachia satsuma]|nr:Calcipressin-3 [Lamellibrachia satsuma]
MADDKSRSSVGAVVNKMGRMSMEDGTSDGTSDSLQSMDSVDGANALIVTKVSDSVFENEQCKAEFEAVFRAYDDAATFQYLKSFKRARVVFNSQKAATSAKLNLHQTDVCGHVIYCYYSHVPAGSPNTNNLHLQPPVPPRNFLISPPTSPPVGWESAPEHEPIVNYDLLTALAGLTPGEAHEFEAASEKHPGIVVHVCEDPEGYIGSAGRIPQTGRPEHT